jgi:hypothetical protein
VYFVARGSLAAGAEAGDHNLYVRHEGVTRLIAVLPSGEQENYDWSSQLGDVMRARVSPDGRWLAFMSEQSLTGYDNEQAGPGECEAVISGASGTKHETGGCSEVYLYGTDTQSLVCASCNPTGGRPVGGSLASLWTAPLMASESGAFLARQPRYLSDSGRLFFDSADALVPQDVNGAEDVYEWEPSGVGTCSTRTSSGSSEYASRENGCVGLISSGTSPAPSEFIDADETGEDVFFRTQARLSPQDYDTAYDVYDAHECTEVSPCSSVVTSPPPCETEASCKAAPEPQPSLYGPPSSATFSGAGNLAAGAASPPSPKKVTKKTVKCKKGFVKNKKNKCVKKPKKKAKKAKRATNDRRVSR